MYASELGFDIRWNGESVYRCCLYSDENANSSCESLEAEEVISVCGDGDDKYHVFSFRSIGSELKRSVKGYVRYITPYILYSGHVYEYNATSMTCFSTSSTSTPNSKQSSSNSSSVYVRPIASKR
jgi:hypothetical protein